MRDKEDYRHHLDVGKVKECIQIVNANPTLRGRESFNVTIDRKKGWGVLENQKKKKKDGRTKAF